MTWHGTLEDGVIVCTYGERRLDALTLEPCRQLLATLIADLLNAVERADHWQDVAHALHNVGYDGP